MATNQFTYNNHTYLLSNAGTWTSAEAQAVALGGHLVTINDKAENDWLFSKFLSGTVNRWIGYTDQETEGVWKWISGENSSYTNWGSPPDNAWTSLNNGIGEDYAHFFMGYNSWNDVRSGVGDEIMQGIIEINNTNSNNTTITSTPISWTAQVVSTGNYSEPPEDLNAVIKNGVLHIAPTLANTSYYWTQQKLVFPTTYDGDNFKFEARVKDPASEGGLSAYDVTMNISSSQNTKNFTGVNFIGASGASSYTYANVPGSIQWSLPKLTQSFNDWHVISIETKNNKMTTTYDGVVADERSYTGSVGMIDSLNLSLKGSGSIDWAKAYSNGQMILNDNFDATTTQILTPTAKPEINLSAPLELNEGSSGGVTPFTFTVTRTGDISGESFVDYAVQGNSSASADDFEKGVFPTGTLHFAAGAKEPSQPLVINVVGDTTVEDDESFSLELLNPVGATLNADMVSGSILNDDVPPLPEITLSSPMPALEIGTIVANEGDSGLTPFTFTVTRTGDNSIASSVKYKVTGDSATADDFENNAFPTDTITFAAGETTSKPFTINVKGDKAVESDEFFSVELLNPVGATLNPDVSAVKWVTVVNDDVAKLPEISISSTTVRHTEGDIGLTPFIFTVTRTGNDTSVDSSVDYYVMPTTASTTPDDFENRSYPSGQVKFAPGKTTETISINIAGDTTFEPDENFALFLSNPYQATINPNYKSVMGEIVNDDVFAYPDLTISELSSNDTSVEKGISFTYDYTVENKSKGDAPASYVGIYLDGQRVSGDDGMTSVNAVSAGGSKDMYSHNIDTSSLTPGLHKLTVKANDLANNSVFVKNIFQESNLDNNEQSITFNVTPASDLHFATNTTAFTIDKTFDLLSVVPYGKRDFFNFNYEGTVNLIDKKTTLDANVAGSNLALKADLNYLLKSNLNWQLPLTFKLDSGGTDINYDYKAEIDYPTSISAGKSFQVPTYEPITRSAKMTAHGPNIEASLKSIISADMQYKLEIPWSYNMEGFYDFGITQDKIGPFNDSGVISLIDYKSVSAKSENTLISLSKLGTNVTDPATGKSNFSDSFSGKIEIPKVLDSDPLKLVKSSVLTAKWDLGAIDFSKPQSAKTIDLNKDSVRDLKAEITSAESPLSITLDIDDLVGYANPSFFGLDGKFPKLGSKKFLGIPGTDYGWEVDLTTELDYSLLGLNFKAELSPAYKKEFISSSDVVMTLKSSWGESKSGKFGDTFTFTTPDNLDPNLPPKIWAEYKLSGDLKTTPGMKLSFGLPADIINLEGTVVGQEIKLSEITKFYPAEYLPPYKPDVLKAIIPDPTITYYLDSFASSSPITMFAKSEPYNLTVTSSTATSPTVVTPVTVAPPPSFESAPATDPTPVAPTPSVATPVTVVPDAFMPKNFTGTAGNDPFISRSTNETFDGGAGFDTLTYKGKLSNFSFSKTTTGITLKDNSGANGTDTLKNIEKIQFDDVSINLTVKEKAATIPVADLKAIQELYIGFFNRIPDADGLSYWIDQRKAGVSITQIADDFYKAGVQYSTSTGYSNAMTNDDFIKIIYANVLERSGLTAPNTDEISFWSQQLTDGTQTRGSVVTSMLDTVHNQYANNPQWGWVATWLDNKVSVANKVAVEWGLTYPTPEASIAKGIDIVNAVTLHDTTAAISLVGVSAVFA